MVQMLDNMQRDPEVSLKTLIGSEQLVLNLRPVDKSKFLQRNSVPSKPVIEKTPKTKLYFKTLEQNLI